MKAMTVQELRDKGVRVSVQHERLLVPAQPEMGPRRSAMPNFDISPRGGTTKVRLEFPSGDIVTGEAHCSDNDNYNKKLGVKIAIGRALTFGTTLIT